jgi:hypothetical protein
MILDAPRLRTAAGSSTLLRSQRQDCTRLPANAGNVARLPAPNRRILAPGRRGTGGIILARTLSAASGWIAPVPCRATEVVRAH